MFFVMFGLAKQSARDRSCFIRQYLGPNGWLHLGRAYLRGTGKVRPFHFWAVRDVRVCLLEPLFIIPQEQNLDCHLLPTASTKSGVIECHRRLHFDLIELSWTHQTQCAALDGRISKPFFRYSPSIFRVPREGSYTFWSLSNPIRLSCGFTSGMKLSDETKQEICAWPERWDV
jgi:hypothetical protein